MTHAQLVTSAYNLLESLRLAGKPVLAAKTMTIQAQLITGRWIDTGRPGWPDLTAVISGNAVLIECKVGHDKQRKHQIDIQCACEAAGGVYLLCTGLEPLRAYLREKGLL